MKRNAVSVEDRNGLVPVHHAKWRSEMRREILCSIPLPRCQGGLMKALLTLQSGGVEVQQLSSWAVMLVGGLGYLYTE
jgi:hypothetical protein